MVLFLIILRKDYYIIYNYTEYIIFNYPYMKTLNKNEKIASGIGILVVGFFFVFGGTVISIFKTGQLPQDQSAVATTTVPQVTVQDVQVGTSTIMAEPGDTITVNYVGAFTNGTVFDSSISRHEPFTFTLGAGQVIPGWDQGLVGMKVGGKRILTVPPTLGYGDKDYGPIPANSTLVFQVELVSVSK